MTTEEMEQVLLEEFAEIMQPIDKAMSVVRAKWIRDMVLHGEATVEQPKEVPDWYWELYVEQLTKLGL